MPLNSNADAIAAAPPNCRLASPSSVQVMSILNSIKPVNADVLFVGASVDYAELAAAKAAGATQAQLAALFTMTNGDPIPDAVVAASTFFPTQTANSFEPVVILNSGGTLSDVTAGEVGVGGRFDTTIAAAYECCITPVCYDGVRTVFLLLVVEHP